MSAKVCLISVGWLPGKGERGAWKEGEREGGLRIESLSLTKSVLGGNIWKLELRIARPICSLNSLQIVPPLRHLHFVLSFLSLQNEKYAVSVCVCVCVCVCVVLSGVGSASMGTTRTIYEWLWQSPRFKSVAVSQLAFNIIFVLPIQLIWLTWIGTVPRTTVSI